MRTAPKTFPADCDRDGDVEAVGGVARRPDAADGQPVGARRRSPARRANAVAPAGASRLESTTVLPGRSTITTRPPVCAGRLRRSAQSAGGRFARLQRILGERRRGERVALDLRGQVLPLVPVVDDRQRHLERDQARRSSARDSSPAAARSRSAAAARPRAPSRSGPDRRASGASAATCTSTVFDDPYHVVCQTSRRMRSRSTTAPALRASTVSRSNSLPVSWTSPPSTIAR